MTGLREEIRNLPESKIDLLLQEYTDWEKTETVPDESLLRQIALKWESNSIPFTMKEVAFEAALHKIELLNKFKTNTFEEFYNAVIHKSDKTQRPGQYACNLLHSVRPDIYNEIADSKFDPFYDDRLLIFFFELVKQLW